MTTQTKVRLIRNIQTSFGNMECLGYFTFWDVRMVDQTYQEVQDRLEQVGLPRSFAHSHNFRSAFSRALKALEEKRIIRRVKEDDEFMVYQFTGERLTEEDDYGALEYQRETRVVVDKDELRVSHNFEKALVECSDVIKPVLINMYNREKDKYNSNDVTRLIHRILRTHADIVPLREQGNVYFVPAGYVDVLNKLNLFMNGLSCRFNTIPIPNVQDSRTMVANAVADQIDAIQDGLDKEIEEVRGGKREVSDRWYEHRSKKVRELRKRINLYADVLDDKTHKAETRLDKLAKIIGVRALDI